MCNSGPVNTDGGTLLFACPGLDTPRFAWGAQNNMLLGNTYDCTFRYSASETDTGLTINIDCRRATDPSVLYFAIRYFNSPFLETPTVTVTATAPNTILSPSLTEGSTPDESVIGLTWLVNSGRTNYRFALFGHLFTRVQGTLMQSSQNTSSQLFMSAMVGSKVEVPTINIFAQFNLQGSNLEQAWFTVNDVKHPDNFCHAQPILVDPTKVVATNFFRKPCMNLVVRGKGCTLVEKVTYLYNKFNTDPEVLIAQFLLSIVTYGLLKYILSYLLYGKFKTSSMLSSNDERFFSDLSNSRYCHFIEAFESPELKGYGRFFRRECA